MNTKKLFTKINQPLALEVQGYLFTLAAFGVTIWATDYRDWVNYVVATFIALFIALLYRMMVAHNDVMNKMLCKIVGVTATDEMNKRERYWFSSLATTLFVPVMQTIFTVSYAMGVSFHASLPIRILATAMMAIIVFIIDRGVVVTMGSKKNWIVAIVRIAVAVSMALFMTKPVEMAIFESEIKQELATQKRDAIHAIEEEKVEAMKDLAQKREDSKGEMKRARDEYEKEVNTSIGGRKAGHGIEARKKLEYAELQEQKNAEEQKRFDADQAKLEKEYQDRTAEWTNNQATGLGARINALERACAKYPGINIMHWIIFCFFMLIDITPVLMKMLMPKSQYDLNEEKLKSDLTQGINKTKLEDAYALVQIELTKAKEIVESMNLDEEPKKNLLHTLHQQILRKYYGHEVMQTINPAD